MEKKIATEEELRKLINQKISTSDELDGDLDLREVRVGTVIRQEKDSNGCNWKIIWIRGEVSNEVGKVVFSIVEEFKQQYNLEDQ